MKARDTGFRARDDLRLPIGGKPVDDHPDAAVQIQSQLKERGAVRGVHIEQDGVRNRLVHFGDQSGQVPGRGRGNTVEGKLGRQTLTIETSIIDDDDRHSPRVWRGYRHVGSQFY